MRKNSDIEALRAYAIALTICAHLARLEPSWDRWVYAFWLGGGVDLFFAISGFVITRSLLDLKRRTARPSILSIIKPFWIRRIYRLWPAAICWAFASVILSIFFNRLGLFGTVEGTLTFALAGIGQFANLYGAVCSAPNATHPCEFSSLAVYWSLSLEEQFYLLAPFALLFLPRKFFVLLLILIAGSQLFLTRDWPSALWFFRTDALCFGVLIGLTSEKTAIIRVAHSILDRKILRATLVGALLIALIGVASPGVVPFYNGAIALIAAALVFIASFDRDYIVQSNLLKRVTNWLGARSFSLYLTHLLAFFAARELYARLRTMSVEGPVQISSVVAIAILLTIVLTEFSYRVIEVPCRNKGRRRAERMLTADAEGDQPRRERAVADAARQ